MPRVLRGSLLLLKMGMPVKANAENSACDTLAFVPCGL